MNVAARLIAFYLPQFHPIPENDRWWQPGFTEWTNVAKAKPLFKGHYQPRLPADLGFYDLRITEVREAQAELAHNAGIEGFCYYHYWFAGRRLLERPFNEVVASGKPEFPFCLCWANATWSGVWYGAPNRILVEQTYPGLEDTRRHFLALRRAFSDRRYLRVDGCPIFVIFRPLELPTTFIPEWRELAAQAGLPGLHFVAHLFSWESTLDYRSRGFDSCVVVSNTRPFHVSPWKMFVGTKERTGANYFASSRPSIDGHASEGQLRQWLWQRWRSSLGKFSNVRLYRHALPYLLDCCNPTPGIYPCVLPNWDNTPRSGVRGSVLHESTPELFRRHMRSALALVHSRRMEERLVFIKSWNEWAEGNYLEPDQMFGPDYLRVVREEVTASQTGCSVASEHEPSSLQHTTFRSTKWRGLSDC